jgi:hypothetical protein
MSKRDIVAYALLAASMIVVWIILEIYYPEGVQYQEEP